MINNARQKFQKAFKKYQHLLEQSVKAGNEEGEILQQSPRWMRFTTWGLMATTGIGITWLAVAKTEEIVVAQGKLEPIGGVRAIQIPVNGVVKSLDVEEGERVHAGQVLLTLDPEATEQSQKSTSNSLKYTKNQLRLKKDERNEYLRLNDAIQSRIKKNINLNQEILTRYNYLVEQGAAATLQLLNQKNRVEELQGQLEEAKVDRRKQTLIVNQSIEQLLTEIARLESELTKENITLKYQKVVSPVDGVVFELEPGGPGYVNRDSNPVLKVVPFDRLLARVVIPSSDIGFVAVGQKADISIDSFPATDFGVLEGEVKSVGSDALPPDQLNRSYRYPADIRLGSQTLKLKSGQTLPLQVGMSLTANIKLRKVSYLQLLLGSFRNKTDSLRQINQSPQPKSGNG